MKLINLFWISVILYDLYRIRNIVLTNDRLIAQTVQEIIPLKYSKEGDTNFLDEINESNVIQTNPKTFTGIIPDFTEPIQRQNTELIYSLDQYCKPDSFGYNEEAGQAVFPKKIYPRCNEKHQGPSRIWIDPNQSMLYMNCTGSYKGKYILGPFKHAKVLTSREADQLWEINEYSKPVKVDQSIEFALGTCSDSLNAKFTEAFMIPREKANLYQNIEKSYDQQKPKLIIMLTLDSISRNHFFRKLPQVVDYLNTINGLEEWKVFDFKLHNIQGPASVDNQVPIFGCNFQAALDQFNAFQPPSNDYQDFVGSNAIWTLLKEKGFVTYLGLENCDNYFPTSIGRLPNVDHATGLFYCGAFTYSDYNMDKENIGKQRCIGSHMSHYYTFNYTLNFLDLYPHTSKWIYLHFNAGHEGSGQHIQTIETDLVHFLQNIVNEKGQKYEISILLQGDHGMRYGDWFKNVNAYQEHKLPSYFHITNKFLTPTQINNIQTNSYRFTSKMDLRKTQLSLAGIQEDTKYGYDLVNEIIPSERTCTETGILFSLCSCLKMTKVTQITPKLDFLFETIQNEALWIINSQGYMNPNHPVGKFCQKLTFRGYSNALHTKGNNSQEIWKYELLVNENLNVKF